jgi:hypothetical protein
MTISPAVPSSTTIQRWHPQATARKPSNTHEIAAAITKAASKQTYYTIRFLVDRDRVADAYRAYAYFRWVDDRLDQPAILRDERIAFAERQQVLVDACYRSENLPHLTLQERILVDLIRANAERNTGLELYVRNMMAVMTFDAHRRNRLITAYELAEYTRWLATAVTEALHYFIGHDDPLPTLHYRYAAVTAADITHMLRDTCDDLAAGYFNMPREFVESNRVDLGDLGSDAYREWVKARVALARSNFATGRRCLSEVKSIRCRLAGYAYMARFEGVLDAIEREGYRLRSRYPECKKASAGLRMLGSALSLLR